MSICQSEEKKKTEVEVESGKLASAVNKVTI